MLANDTLPMETGCVSDIQQTFPTFQSIHSLYMQTRLTRFPKAVARAHTAPGGAGAQRVFRPDPGLPHHGRGVYSRHFVLT